MSRKNHRQDNYFVPYEKMSKSDKRERDKEKRGDWGGVDPRTRREDRTKYKRKKQKERDDYYFEDNFDYYE